MRNPWLREYWEHHFNCKWPKGKTDKDRSSENAKTDKYLKLLNDDGGTLKECTGKEVISKENGENCPFMYISYTVKKIIIKNMLYIGNMTIMMKK